MAQQVLNITTGGDDGFGVEGSSFYTDTTTLYFGDDGTETATFLRFALTASLSGGTVDSAYLTGVFQESYGTTIEIDAIDEADASAPTSSAGLFGEAGTTAKVVWNPDPTGGGGARTSPDIKTVIQELVDSYTMASGDHIVLMLREGSQTTTYANEIASYEHATNDPAELEINFTTGQQETTSGTINGGGGIAAAVDKAWSVSVTVNGGGSMSASATRFVNQVAQPISTVAAGAWDTGPTTGQSLHGYTSDSSDSTYIEDTS